MRRPVTIGMFVPHKSQIANNFLRIRPAGRANLGSEAQDVICDCTSGARARSLYHQLFIGGYAHEHLTKTHDWEIQVK